MERWVGSSGYGAPGGAGSDLPDWSHHCGYGEALPPEVRPAPNPDGREDTFLSVSVTLECHLRTAHLAVKVQPWASTGVG